MNVTQKGVQFFEFSISEECEKVKCSSGIFYIKI